MGRSNSPKSKTFHFVMIKPSHYDDDGYVIQWYRSWIPSNSLAAVYGLAIDCRDRRVLGEDVDLVLSACDETNTRIRPSKIIRQIRRDGGRGLVALVGVQSNQFPRAIAIGRAFRDAGVQVCVGGFHVSGCLSMLPELPPEILEAQALGISLFAGEAEEGRLARVLCDARRGALEPIYNYLDELPDMQGEAVPFLPYARVKRTFGSQSSFDAGRGCPFQCSFCTIINVQGRKSRFRSADDIERIVRSNFAQGVKQFFIADDNFARNKDWEVVFDRLIKLRNEDGLRTRFLIQVDTLCHRIPNFIEKAGLAGVDRVFIGLENINPDNLAAANKRQNRITEYRAMLQAWKDVGARTYAGYILGFPTDTVESITRDIEIIQRELPLDIVEFFNLTPLPGSEDHRNMHLAGSWMDPDLNKYDLNHVTARHPLMSTDAWHDANRLAWERYYTLEHIETVMRRAVARGINIDRTMADLLWFYTQIFYERVHPLEGGIVRFKFRRDRRPGLPVEAPFGFYLRYSTEMLVKHAKILWFFLRVVRIRNRIMKDPNREEYTDLAMSPVASDELDAFDLFTVTDAARVATDRERKRRSQSASRKMKAVPRIPEPPAWQSVAASSAAPPGNAQTTSKMQDTS